jgi:hypothetical protein
MELKGINTTVQDSSAKLTRGFSVPISDHLSLPWIILIPFSPYLIETINPVFKDSHTVIHSIDLVLKTIPIHLLGE